MSNQPNEDSGESPDTGLNAMTSPSLESTASVSSGTTGRFTSERPDTTEALITSYGQNLFDTVCAIIWCPNHKRMALKKLSDTKGFFFPSKPVRMGQSWFECTINLLKEVLRVSDPPSGVKPYPSFSPPKMVNVFRIQIPIYCEFVSRIIFFTELTFETKYVKKCCQNTQLLNWFSDNSVIGGRLKELWGPEPGLYFQLLIKSSKHPFKSVDYFIENTMRDTLLFAPREQPKSIQEEMVKSTGVTEKDIFVVFGEFFQHTFPSQYMTYFSFADYINRFGYPELSAGIQLNMKAVFRSFSFNSLDYLSFNEFLLGLCAMDKNCVHRQVRITYLFRYYSGNYQTGIYLDIDDISAFARDLIRVRSGGQLNESLVENEVRAILTLAKCERQIDQKSFMKLISEGKIRNTSLIYRSANNLVQHLQTKRVYESLQLIQIQSPTAVEAKLQRIRGTCQRCRQKKYTLASHTVRLSNDGYIVDPQENKGQSDVQRMPVTLRRMSHNCFNGGNTANILLDHIRSFALEQNLNNTSSNRTNRGSGGVWKTRSSRMALLDKILSLLSQCEQIFKKEPRVLRVCSPVFVLGDIHGNLKDVMIYEKALWKMGPTCVAADFLFLGDYVDRGENSVECILYLFCLKVLSPEKYWLLRGNHELRPVQVTFTFKNECTDKFGTKEGSKLWEAFNKVFDYMPICAIIDESIFCAHGGIPTSSLKVEELYKMPIPLEDPENQFPNAWQMLWNDPVTNQEYRDYEEVLRGSATGTAAKIPGFLPNTKRGTAYYYSDEALTKFLSANQLSHVIRAHEVIPNGYAFHMGGKCITIFSSSRYCGGLNEAAVILVNDEKIRVVKIDTS